MRADEFLDAPDQAPPARPPRAGASAFLDDPAAPIQPSAPGSPNGGKSATAFLDEPVPQPSVLDRAIDGVRGAVARFRADRVGTPPTADELERAARPAAMTMTRGGQPVLQPNAPAPQPEPRAP